MLASCKDANRTHAESTTNYSIKNSDYKVVVYVDSVGCTSCKLHLPRWVNLIQQVDSMSSPSVEFLFFFFPKEGRDIYHTLRMEEFDYPVCMDESDSFNKLNHFPSDVRFQTFLLDKDGKVIAIGNPVHSPKVKELYLNIILGDRAPKKEEKAQTTVACNNTNVDLGKFDWKQKQTARFTLENTGNSPLAIVDVTTSCGCTSVEYPKEPVRAGKSVEIKVHYQADQPEYFNKTITVHCNSAASPIKLAIKGNAEYNETSS